MKFKGFYRLLPEAPSMVIPLFEDKEGKLFAQKSNEIGLVVDYFCVEISDLNRIFIDKEQNILAAKKGEPALSAIEYRKNFVRVFSATKLKQTLSELLNKNQLSDNPFFALEVARLVSDDIATTRFKRICAAKLRNTSVDIANKWVDGFGGDIDGEDNVIPVDQNLKFKIRIPKRLLNVIERLASLQNMKRNKYIDFVLDEAMKNGNEISHKVVSNIFLRYNLNNDIQKIYSDLFPHTKKIENKTAINLMGKPTSIKWLLEFLGYWKSRPTLNLSTKNTKRINEACLTISYMSSQELAKAIIIIHSFEMAGVNLELEMDERRYNFFKVLESKIAFDRGDIDDFDLLVSLATTSEEY